MSRLTKHTEPFGWKPEYGKNEKTTEKQLVNKMGIIEDAEDFYGLDFTKIFAKEIYIIVGKNGLTERIFNPFRYADFKKRCFDIQVFGLNAKIYWKDFGNTWATDWRDLPDSTWADTMMRHSTIR